MSDFAGGHLFFLMLGWLPWLLLIAGAVVVAVLGLRTLFRIDRSLRILVEQGVARGGAAGGPRV